MIFVILTHWLRRQVSEQLCHFRHVFFLSMCSYFNHKQILPNQKDVEILSHAMNHQNSIGSKSICCVFDCTPAYIQRSIPQHSKTQRDNNDDDCDEQQSELQYKPTQMSSHTICKLLCVSVTWQRKQEATFMRS